MRRPDEGAAEGLATICRAVSPALVPERILAAQACWRPVTRDGLPLVGPVPGARGAFAATGHGVWGILLAPATGEVVAELVLEGAARTVDLAPFDPARLPPRAPRAGGAGVRHGAAGARAARARGRADVNAPDDDAAPGAAVVTPMSEVQALRFAEDGTVPNNPVLPALLMRGAIAPGASAEAIAVRLEASGWGGTWVWRVFPYHHYHPNAHEALVVAMGRAALMLGGPRGERVAVGAGDVVVLPAGTGHRQLEASADFAVVGAYPLGQEACETVRAEQPHDPTTLKRIAAVPRPRTDPVHGAGGPLIRAWSG